MDDMLLNSERKCGDHKGSVELQPFSSRGNSPPNEYCAETVMTASKSNVTKMQNFLAFKTAGISKKVVMVKPYR